MGSAKSLMYDIMFRKDAKPSTSHHFDVRDAMAGNGNSGTSLEQFRNQERRWQVVSVLGNQQVMDGKRNGGLDWIATSSKAFSNDGPPNITVPSTGSSLRWQGRSHYNSDSRLQSTSSDPVVIDDGIRHQFEMPFPFEVDSF